MFPLWTIKSPWKFRTKYYGQSGCVVIEVTVNHATDTLVSGFLDDPFFIWAVPDSAARLTLLESLFSLATSTAAARGFLRLDSRGVVILVPPGQRLYDAGQAAQAQALLRDAFQHPLPVLEDYQCRLRSGAPDDADAWYLHYLAVPAADRGRGYGSSLMRAMLDETDDAKLWLHTGRQNNLAFYAKFGLDVAVVTLCEPAGPAIYTLST